MSTVLAQKPFLLFFKKKDPSEGHPNKNNTEVEVDQMATARSIVAEMAADVLATVAAAEAVATEQQGMDEKDQDAEKAALRRLPLRRLPLRRLPLRRLLLRRLLPDWQLKLPRKNARRWKPRPWLSGMTRPK